MKTYVHHLHNDDREVLMERVEGEHREPWTWTRKVGKGRVFYTAYGHDERTWSNPGFHRLIENAILWAVDQKVVENWRKLSFPEYSYIAKPNIPNYEKRDPAPKFQEPFEQPDSEKLIQIPPGFKLELFASEPDIINPIAMAWDEKGRLWIAETIDYPNEVKSEQKGDDRIKICEDTDGDGKADKFTIFADGLNIPTSLVFAQGGIIVSQAPHFLFLADTDGDDKADVREELITGWGTYDTHAGPSNLKYGFDNQIWGTVGYSGFEGTIAGKERKFRQGFYRFTPDVSEFEFLTSTSNNTWGLGFSETFDVFGSTANNAHSWYMAIPNRYFDGVEGLITNGSKKIASYYDFHPITPNVRQVDVFGGFTAAAGHNLYTARSFPESYWNRVALVCEPTGHLLAKGILEKEGAGFTTKDGWNLMASADEWVSPVHAEVGPDGAVWVSDWYNFIIQHNPTPTPERGGFDGENGEGNAHINPLRDRNHGRIYRVVYDQAKTYRPISLNKENPQQLVETLKNDNLFWRMTAQRLLVERGNQDVISDLLSLVKNQKTDELGINAGAIHAIWTLHGLGALNGNNEEVNEAVLNALSHQSAGVRKAAIQTLPVNWKSRDALLTNGSIADKDLHTRLAGILALSQMPPSEESGESLVKALDDETNMKDIWLSQALYIAAFRHRKEFVSALEKSGINLDVEEEKPLGPFDWNNPEEMVADWETMKIPSFWEREGLPGLDGEVWFYRSFEWNGSGSAKINLGRVDDTDESYINGKLIGSMKRDWSSLRSYQIPAGILKRGTNHLLVKVSDAGGRGGIGGKEDELDISRGSNKLPLGGEWKYTVAKVTRQDLIKPVFENKEDLITKLMKNVRNISEASDSNTESSGYKQVTIKTVLNKMAYDQQEIELVAGETVEIVFENIDLLQHNLLIATPGSLERVGEASDELARDPNGIEKSYVPEMEEVLFSIGLTDPKEIKRKIFTVPDKPGDYPFICTFPGHWQQMNGIFKVKAKAI